MNNPIKLKTRQDKTIIIIIILIYSLSLGAQDSNQSINNNRTIKVIGSASMDIMPDVIILSVSLEEYWMEQFLTDTNKDDYKTKIYIDEIETRFFDVMDDIDISRDSILLLCSGRNWLWPSKSIFYKKYNISIPDFNIADKILFALDFHGIKSAHISELKNKDIPQFREEVKKQAMLAAKNKAEYLLETIEEELGRVITVRELNYESNSFFYRPSTSAYSNVSMGSAGEMGNEDVFRSIPLRYEIEAVYEIKDKSNSIFE